MKTDVVRNWPGAMGVPPHQLPTEGTMLLIKPALYNRLDDELGAALVGAMGSWGFWGDCAVVVG